VLLDQKLQGPGGPDSGLDLIVDVGRLAPFAKTIVVTGYATPPAIERAFRSGVYDHLMKNGAFEALLRATRDKLHGREVMRRSVVEMARTVGRNTVVDGRATGPDPRRKQACPRSPESCASAQILCDTGVENASEYFHRSDGPRPASQASVCAVSRNCARA